MNYNQIRSLIKTVLIDMGEHKGNKFYSNEAVDLIIMTAAHESNKCEYIEQVGGGPALGIFQIEPNTHDDLYENFFKSKPELGQIVTNYKSNQDDIHLDIKANLLYGIVICRMIYYRQKESLPKERDYKSKNQYYMALAKYAKKYWNTYAENAKATVEDYYNAFMSYSKGL